ncbi:hypothetical protein HDV06_000864 [Boothiomyces sp. JEL0866]|nr:hypothetical protein HDV06_000864 [Boothiomyces sp. JEL0866]
MSNKTYTCTNCTLKQIQAVDALPLSSMDSSVTGPVYQSTKAIVDFCGFTDVQSNGGNSTTPTKSNANRFDYSAVAFTLFSILL